MKEQKRLAGHSDLDAAYRASGLVHKPIAVIAQNSFLGSGRLALLSALTSNRSFELWLAVSLLHVEKQIR
jgi:hypothetical protein